MIYIDRTSPKAKRLWGECMLITVVGEANGKKYYFAGSIRVVGKLAFRREVRAVLKEVSK